VIEFVFMLTHDDVTVGDAAEVLATLRDSGLRYVGFKDVGLPADALAAVTEAAHASGMQVILEVVSVTAEDELRSLRAAPAIGVDWVLGGTHATQGCAILAGTGIRYCPFPGTVVGHPSELRGSIREIADDAARLTAMDGVHGLDLLAYRHRGADPVALTRAVVEAAEGPVIAAGSVASLQQIAALESAGAWGFTIGGAIFEGRLPGGPSVAGQVSAVLSAA
jgi:sugar phosphate isomerase/epimerase